MDPHSSGTRKGPRGPIHADNDALWDWNLESDRIHFSPRWISLAGFQDQELGNTPDEWLQRVHPEDIDTLLRDIDTARGEGSEFEFRYRLRHKDGTHRWMASRGVVVRNERGEAIHLTGSQFDVTVETVTDASTGLPNRLLLLDRLTQSIERARRYRAFHFAVLIVDLGRPAGRRESGSSTVDPLLTAAARRLETCLRIPDTTPSLRHNDLVARLEGDEFAILLDGLKDVGHAKAVADRMLAEMLSPFAMNGREVRLRTSIGIAVSATGYVRAEDVLRDAQTALHRAQVLGGSHGEVFDTAILKSTENELRLEAEFESALERREFEVFFQPIISLASNQVVGFEALVRWKHPVLGLIAPLDFIPLAETTGFIVPLGGWILREACLQLRSWQTSAATPADLWMSVNLSGVQLKHGRIVEDIAEILHESGVDPRSLVLELTEGVAMENPTAVKSLLMRLRAMGVRISLDDFGTGYSSLAYLQRFPADALKLDRSFVRAMPTDKDTAEIVASLVAMARQLGLKIIAEGVEHEDQLDMLRALRCTAVQGELFAKPLDAAAATAFLEAGNPVSVERSRPGRTAVRPGSSWRAIPGFGHWVTSSRTLWIAASITPLLAAGAFAALFSGTPSDTEIAARSQPVPAAPAVPATPTAASSPTPQAPTQPAAPRGSANTAATAPQPPSSASYDVSHLHRLGSCRGRLVVSGKGVAFIPSDGDDAFTLEYSQFLPKLDDDVLTFKTTTRTYRMKTVAADGNGPPPSIRTVFDRIERFSAGGR